MIDVGDVLSRSWQAFNRNAGTCIALLLLAGAISIGVSLGVTVLEVVVTEASGSKAASVLVRLAGQVIDFVVTTFLSLGLIPIGLGMLRGEQVEIGQLFSGTSKLLNGLLAKFLYSLTVVAAMLPGVVAGGVAAGAFDTRPEVGLLVGAAVALPPLIYVATAGCLAIYFVADMDVGPVVALRRSFEGTQGAKLGIVAWAILSTLIAGAGLLACGVGLLVALPVYYLGYAEIYRTLSAPYQTETPREQASYEGTLTGTEDQDYEKNPYSPPRQL